MKIIIAFISMIAIGLALVCIVNFETVQIDGVKGEIRQLVFNEDTIYGYGYTSEDFRQLKIGSSKEEVLGALGEPLSKWSPSGMINKSTNNRHEIWSYTESPTLSHYRLRNVSIVHGKVEEIVGYYYVD